ncbi:MAG: hypothetical protein ACLGI8_13240 [Acidimicrobiia bacterium]
MSAGEVRAGTGAATPFRVVLRHLAQPHDPVRVTAALVGLPIRAARQLVGTWVATSPEADRLLTAMPRLLRSLAIATTDRPERCYGELRGPVLWSETMSARSASAGDPGLFVCATTTKAYDTDENRVLKAALAAIARAGAEADAGSPVPGGAGPDDARRARHQGQAANHLLEHRTLADVPATVPRGRALQRTRAGSRRGTYEPAIALLRRAGSPWPPGALEALSADAVHRQVAALAAVIEAWRSHPRGGGLALRTSHGALVAGPVRYEHLTGVHVGSIPVLHAAEAEEALARTLGSP